jgi:cation transport ATPase
MLGCTRVEFIALVVAVIVALVVFTMILMQAQNWYRDGGSTTTTKVTLPPWLMIILFGILVGILTYGGYIIFSGQATQNGDHKRAEMIALWVGSLVALLAASTAFFERKLYTEAAYLFMIFIALHASVAYKFRFTSLPAFWSYLVAAVGAVYILLDIITYIP